MSGARVLRLADLRRVGPRHFEAGASVLGWTAGDWPDGLGVEDRNGDQYWLERTARSESWARYTSRFAVVLVRA